MHFSGKLTADKGGLVETERRQFPSYRRALRAFHKTATTVYSLDKCDLGVKQGEQKAAGN